MVKSMCAMLRFRCEIVMSFEAIAGAIDFRITIFHGMIDTVKCDIITQSKNS